MCDNTNVPVNEWSNIIIILKQIFKPVQTADEFKKLDKSILNRILIDLAEIATTSTGFYYFDQYNELLHLLNGDFNKLKSFIDKLH